jgi:drug/metabolite transporter (DMT)-like permease
MIIGLGEALSLGCALTWAVGVIIYKRLGEQLPPLKLCLLKNLIVLALVAATVAVLASPLAPALGLRRLPMPAMDASSVVLALASGVIGIAVADTLYLRALNVLGAGRMGVVGNLFSPFVILLSVAFLGEQLGPCSGPASPWSWPAWSW